MLTMNETEAAYARFLSETNCKRLPKTADALFTQLEKQLRTIDEAETGHCRRPVPDGESRQPKPQSACRIRRFDGQFGNDLREGFGRRSQPFANLRFLAGRFRPKAPLICAKTIDRP